MIGLTIKTENELAIMAEAGKKLAKVKNELKSLIKPGENALEIEETAQKLIKKSGAEASFTKVPNYHWATCINVNAGLVHGIPKAETVFAAGDLVSVDLGLKNKGFHSDTSFSIGVEASKTTEAFLEVGRQAFKAATEAAKPGNRIFDISMAIEEVVEAAGFSPIRALTGHGIGRELHEEPQIPCFTFGERAKSPEIVPGMALAIEVMYAQGKPEVILDKDEWTITMRDGKISALFEETVAISKHGPLVLTEG